MKTILREETSGVSEVIGTILILGMTVTLFSTVILWVSSFPTPQVQTRSDLSSHMEPIYGAGGLVVGVNITLTHLGGEALQPASTVFYITDQPSSGPASTDVATLHRFNAFLAVPSGLIDGSDSVWSTGERWLYLNQAFRPSDAITITIVDNTRSLVVWSGPMNPASGTRPPVFMNVWATGVVTGGGPNPVYAGSGFYLFADVFAPDNNLNTNSVYAMITAFYNTTVGCQFPLKMRDDGVFPDLVPGDGIFAVGATGCMSPPYPLQSWSGSLVLLNATDARGHRTQTQFILNVLPTLAGTGGMSSSIPTSVWQYIGFVQIRTGEVWLTNLSLPYTTTTTFQPYRVMATSLTTNGGALFHFKMSNHGNTTIFIDGWTEAFFQNTQSSAGQALYIVAPCNPSLHANAGGIAAYPGSATNINNFSYAHPGLPSSCTSSVQPAVFDINKTDQQTGGTPYTVLIYPKTPYSPLGGTFQWKGGITYYISLLVSGMAGPNNYTYAQLTGKDPFNPYGCTGLDANYNPLSHLNDLNVACRSTWYAQVIPFIGMVVY